MTMSCGEELVWQAPASEFSIFCISAKSALAALFDIWTRTVACFFFSSRRRHTRWNCDWSFRRVLFRSASAFVAILFVIALLAIVIFVRGKLLKLAIIFGAFAAVVLWWLTLKPSNDREWQPDVAETAWADINGDEVTIHNVRNCDYRTQTDFTPHWETRTVRLSQIT